MQQDLIDKVAWIGKNLLFGPAKGIVLVFQGLGYAAMKMYADPLEVAYGAAGAIVVAPDCGPWNWMNGVTQDFVDELVDALRQRYKLGEESPLVATGGSMGGMAALMYTMNSRHRVSGCLANCPVCDVPFSYTERPDVPRTLHFALNSYGDIEQLMREHSPLHQVARLPDVPYMIVHGTVDVDVSIARHSEPMVAAMKARKLNVDYRVAKGMEHCLPLPLELQMEMAAFVARLLR